MSGLKKSDCGNGCGVSSERCAVDALFDREINVAEHKSLLAFVDCRSHELKMGAWLLQSMLATEMRVEDVNALKAYQLKDAVSFVSNFKGLN